MDERRTGDREVVGGITGDRYFHFDIDSNIKEQEPWWFLVEPQ